MISRDDLQAKIRVWLFDELAPSGSTVVDVYQRLMERGCHGVQGNAGECPVAKFLKGKLDELVRAGDLEDGTHVAVGHAFMTVYDHRRQVVLTDFWLPPVVADFISIFDDNGNSFAPLVAS